MLVTFTSKYWMHEPQTCEYSVYHMQAINKNSFIHNFHKRMVSKKIVSIWLCSVGWYNNCIISMKHPLHRRTHACMHACMTTHSRTHTHIVNFMALFKKLKHSLMKMLEMWQEYLVFHNKLYCKRKKDHLVGCILNMHMCLVYNVTYIFKNNMENISIHENGGITS